MKKYAVIVPALLLLLSACQRTDDTLTLKPQPENEQSEPYVPFTLAFTRDISIAENYKVYQNAVKKGYKDQDTALLEITFASEEGEPLYRIIPCSQTDGRVNDESETERGKRILSDLQALSPTVEIDAEGYVTFGVN